MGTLSLPGGRGGVGREEVRWWGEGRESLGGGYLRVFYLLYDTLLLLYVHSCFAQRVNGRRL